MNEIKRSTVVNWMNALRNLPHDQRYRALEGFWDTQLDSKCWIIDTIIRLNLSPTEIRIFGGWTGVLASLFLSNDRLSIQSVRSIDIDPWCESVAGAMCGWDSRFTAQTCDMAQYLWNVTYGNTLVVNTSTEHVSQEVYDRWWNSIPIGTTVVIQGNNFFTCNEHIRCAASINEFLEINRATNIIYSGELSNPQYTRYMGIFYR